MASLQETDCNKDYQLQIFIDIGVRKRNFIFMITYP